MNYKVSFIRFSYQRFYLAYRDEVLEAFDRCARNGDFMLREETREFEKKLSSYIGTKYTVAVNSGTDAMFLSLKALDIGKGDEVITVSHTFIATLQAIVHTGATPILVDVGEDELMDMDEVEKSITTRTRAILPVHFHGKVVDLVQWHKLFVRMVQGFFPPRLPHVVEDAAQSLGAIIPGTNKKAGSYGTTGCFSFNFPKLLGAYGDAGAVVTNNEETYKKLLLLRSHWNITQGSVRSEDYPQPEEMGWGWKSRMDNIQAAILLVKFKYLPDMLKRRKEISNRYDEGLKDLPLKLPTHQDGEVVQEYVIRVQDNKAFKEFMEREGIEVLVRDTVPNHRLKGLGLSHFDLPMTELLARESVRLPIFPELLDSEVEMVINAVKKYYL